MLQKIWQRIGYYFRIDFRTIQGRLTGGFISLAVIAGSTVLFNHLQWMRISKERDYIMEVIDPSLMLINTVTLEVERSHHYMEQNNFTEEALRKSLWDYRVIPQKDSLEGYSQLWDDKKNIRTFRKFREEIEALQELQSKINAGQESLMAPDEMFESLRFWANILSTDLEALKVDKLADGKRMVNRMNWLLLVSFIVALMGASVLGSIIITSLLNKIRSLKSKVKLLASGQLPEKLEPTRDEMNTIINSMNSLVDHLRHITDFAKDVGDGNFESKLSVFNNEGALGQSLAGMRESLLAVAEDNKRRRWFNEGITQFADLMRKHNKDLDELCDAVIRHLVHYLDSTQGAIFIVNNSDEDDIILEMRGLYAYDRKKFLNYTLKPGQGLAGQAYREQEKIILKEIPQDYTEVTSGLGDATPTFLAIMPMISNEEIYGVIEIAAFHDLQDHEVEFYEKVSENIAAAIATVKINQETKRLLEDSQMSTEQLRAQEEEMRQNAEELEATQEEIHRQMREASEQRDMFVSLIENVDGVIYRSRNDENWTKVYLSDNVEVFTGYHSSQFLLKGKSFAEIIHPDDFNRINKITEECLRIRKKWTIEYRIVKRDSEVIWVEEKGKGVYDEQGRVTFIDGIIMDISERIEKQQSQKATA